MLLSKILHSVLRPLEIEINDAVELNPPKKKKKPTKSNLDLITGEVWKDVVGFEDTHEISSHGRAARKPFRILRSDGKTQTYQWKLLKPHFKPGGIHPRYRLQVNGVVKTPYIQQMICEAFNLQLPGEKECFCRLDPFVLPTLETIKIVNRSEYLSGRQHRSRSPLSMPERKTILLLRQEGLSREKVSKMFNLTPETVSAITGNISR